MGRTVDQTNQSGKIVDSGKPNSLGTVNK
jgi:hypothetical protein